MTTEKSKTSPKKTRGTRVSVADEVYEKVKQDIAEFRLIPGDRFTENELSLRLHVSRTPVRQSLYRLQQEGYVEVLFRSGWRVLPFDFEKFEQLYDLRILLESAAVAKLCDATVVRTPQGQALVDALAAIWLVAPDQRSADTAQVSQWDEQFHCALVQACGNMEIARVHKEVTDRIRLIRPDVPVLFMSGYMREGELRNLDRATDFLQKPFKLEDLQEKLRLLLSVAKG